MHTYLHEKHRQDKQTNKHKDKHRIKTKHIPRLKQRQALGVPSKAVVFVVYTVTELVYVH